jgi:hypothetical protein
MLKANKYIERLRRTRDKGAQMRHARLRLPWSRFCALIPYMTKDTIEGLKTIDAPAKFRGHDVPRDLQMADFGTLIRLQGCGRKGDWFWSSMAIVETLTGAKQEAVATAPAEDVLGIVNMVEREMARIGRLFQSLQGGTSGDEVAAGIDRLDFGAFGIVDWYARRMGIVDHEEVFALPWQRIFQCMKIDHENNEFEKRYRKIIEQRSKTK